MIDPGGITRTARIKSWRMTGTLVMARPEYVLAVVATVLLPLAVLFPFFTVSPSFGDPILDAVYEYINPGTLGPKTHSVLSGIVNLF